MFGYFLFLLIPAGCQNRSCYRIEGHLPDSSSDGEFIYLVPFENAVKERVDSTRIENNKFQFEGTVQTPEICILRTRPLLRLKLQELLVVKEPGIINVKFDSTSSACGTALNDSLQHWKDKKMEFDRQYDRLKQKYRSADDSVKNEMKQRADHLKEQIENYHFNFVKRNRENAVGKMVLKMMGTTFTPDQKKELGFQ
jgi:hypothetical protein